MEKVKEADVALIGPLAKDKIVIDGCESAAVGGSVYYGSFPLNAMGLKAAIISKLARSDFGLLDEFKKAGISVFASPSEHTAGIKNIFSAKDVDNRIHVPIATIDPFEIKDLPLVKAKIFHICPLMKGEISLPLVKALSQRTKNEAKLALDVQGFIRKVEGKEIKYEEWAEQEEILKLIHFLKADSAEAKFLTKKDDPRMAAKELASYGPEEVMITHAGGILMYVKDKDKFYEAPFKCKVIKGRTGRGDTCIAAYIGKRLTDSVANACKFAAAVASIKLEKPGPFKLNLRSESAVREILRPYM